MAAVWTSWESDTEPVPVDDVKKQCLIDHDEDDEFLKSIIIPTARQLAETKAGSAIRKGLYREFFPKLPAGAIYLGRGCAFEMVRVLVGNAEQDVAAFPLQDLGNDVIVTPDPALSLMGAVTFEYKAGIDIENFPTVKQWILLACAWLYEQRELLMQGQPVQAIPSTYVDALLVPITTSARF